MASRRLEFAPCECKNMCQRAEAHKRNPCPCLMAELYCTHLCKCGTQRQECVNRHGKGGALDRILGVKPKPDNEEDDEEQVVLAANQDGVVSIIVEKGLNRSFQALEEEQFEPGTIDQAWSNIPRSDDFLPVPATQIKSLSDTEVRTTLLSILNDHPHLATYLSQPTHTQRESRECQPESPQPLESPQPPESPQTPEGSSEPDSPPQGSPPNSPPGGDPHVAKPHWCNCGNCQPMPQPIEEKCCVKSKSKSKRSPKCELESHANDIAGVVLNLQVLITALRQRNDLMGLDDQPTNATMRLVAYRQYVLWRFGRLGRGNRVVIPSCIVWAVRRAYPEPNGVYVGFTVGRFG